MTLRPRWVVVRREAGEEVELFWSTSRRLSEARLTLAESKAPEGVSYTLERKD